MFLSYWLDEHGDSKSLQKHTAGRIIRYVISYRRRDANPSYDRRSPWIAEYDRLGEEFKRTHEAFVDYCDCKSLEEHLRNDVLAKTQDKRLAIDLAALRQLIWQDENGNEVEELRGDLPDQIKWVDTSVMLVDALTKDMNGNHLRACLKEGTWSLKPSAESEVNKMKKQKYRMLKTLEKYGNENEENT